MDSRPVLTTSRIAVTTAIIAAILGSLAGTISLQSQITLIATAGLTGIISIATNNIIRGHQTVTAAGKDAILMAVMLIPITALGTWSCFVLLDRLG